MTPSTRIAKPLPEGCPTRISFKALTVAQRLAPLILFVFAGPGNAGTDLPDVTIASSSTSFEAGSPLVLTLTYDYKQAITQGPSEETRTTILHSAYLTIEYEDTNPPGTKLRIFPLDLRLVSGTASRYSGTFIFLYHHEERRPLFGEPGVYTVKAHGHTRTSNALTVVVRPPSSLQERALALLSSEPSAFYFLEQGEFDDSGRRKDVLSALAKVTQECRGTLLASWAAARLGLQEAKEFWDTHPNPKSAAIQALRSEQQEPLASEAYSHLSEGLKLPPEFPLREKVLYESSKMAFAHGDFEAASSLLDKLGDDYPDGIYGGKAKQAKTELEQLAQSLQGIEARSSSRLTVGIVVAACVLLVSLLALLYFRRRIFSHE